MRDAITANERHNSCSTKSWARRQKSGGINGLWGNLCKGLSSWPSFSHFRALPRNTASSCLLWKVTLFLNALQTQRQSVSIGAMSSEGGMHACTACHSSRPGAYPLQPSRPLLWTGRPLPIVPNFQFPNRSPVQWSRSHDTTFFSPQASHFASNFPSITGISYTTHNTLFQQTRALLSET